MWRVEELGSGVVGVVRKLQVAVYLSNQIKRSGVSQPPTGGLEGGQGGGREA